MRAGVSGQTTARRIYRKLLFAYPADFLLIAEGDDAARKEWDFLRSRGPGNRSSRHAIDSVREFHWMLRFAFIDPQHQLQAKGALRREHGKRPCLKKDRFA